MSPRRNARRLEQVLPPRATAPANRHPLRVVAMQAAPATFVSEPTAKARVPAGLPAQRIAQWAEALVHVAKRAMQMTRPVARQAWVWLCTETGARIGHSKTRRLRLAETLSLGEKRFVSLVEVDGQAFLIGGSASGISLLAEFQGKRAEASFGSVIEKARWPESESA